jgi:hypothetical protein
MPEYRRSWVKSGTFFFIVVTYNRLPILTYVTAWAYNSADLVTSMTYPSGEVVAHTYTPQMLLDELASYVSS